MSEQPLTQPRAEALAEVLACHGLPAWRLPENIEPEHDAIYASYCQTPLPAMELKCLRHVAVSSSGLIYKRGRRLGESLPGYFDPGHGEVKKVQAQLRAGSRRRCLRDHFCRIPVFAGPRAYWCADWYSNSYFHWLIETLARVHLATLEAESPVVYLPATVAVFPFVRESFALFPEVDFRILQWRETLWASRLHWVSPMGSGYQFNRRLMQLLRERIRKAGEPSGCTDNPRRLHVSRRKSGKRKLLNEEAIERCLSARGFQTVYFEELSLRRQIELCAGAEALVGIHGAGLANALFLPKNSVVLEMQMFQTWPSCYFRLCNALDLKYYYLYGRHSPPSATSESEADLEVDAGRLETILDAAGL